jgi:hypothetical protein
MIESLQSPETIAEASTAHQQPQASARNVTDQQALSDNLYSSLETLDPIKNQRNKPEDPKHVSQAPETSPGKGEDPENKAQAQRRAQAAKLNEFWQKGLMELENSGKHEDIVRTIRENLILERLKTENLGPDNTDGSLTFKDVQQELSGASNELQNSLATQNFVKRAVSVFSTVAPIFDVVATYDPVHAALPWAAVRTVVMVSERSC